MKRSASIRRALRVDDERRRRGARGYTNRQRLINLVGIGLFVALTGFTLRRMATLAPEVTWWPCLALVSALVALPFADFLSGFVHWAADNWGSGDWPLVGGFVQPFRNHHDDPLEMTRHGFVERHGDNCIISMPAFACAHIGFGSPAWQLAWSGFWLATAFWVLGTNQFHAWAHMPDPPRFARWLQHRGLILSPEHHAVHHRCPHDDNYCITNGWMDRPLRWLRFFAALEWLLTRLTGVAPRHRQLRQLDEVNK